MADQYLLTVLTLTVTTTVLVIWVVEPSAMRLLGRWLHGPQLRVRDAVGRAPALWRIRVRLDDRPGRLEALTARLADHAVNIRAVHVHRLESGVLDELVVSAPDGLTAQALTGAVRQAGGAGVRVWPASPLTLVDGQTKALGIAARVAADPDELPLALAELLVPGIWRRAPITDRRSRRRPGSRWCTRTPPCVSSGRTSPSRPPKPHGHTACATSRGRWCGAGESVVRGVGQRSLGGA